MGQAANALPPRIRCLGSRVLAAFILPQIFRFFFRESRSLLASVVLNDSVLT